FGLWQVTHLSSKMGWTRIAKNVARAAVPPLAGEAALERDAAVTALSKAAAAEPFFGCAAGMRSRERSGRGINSVRYFSPWLILPPWSLVQIINATGQQSASASPL